jgi:hypothetical protein
MLCICIYIGHMAGAPHSPRAPTSRGVRRVSSGSCPLQIALHLAAFSQQKLQKIRGALCEPQRRRTASLAHKTREMPLCWLPLLLALARPGTVLATWKLHLMTDHVAAGAVCLDGTPGGFYMEDSATDADPTQWQIAFAGGGWCYSDDECEYRASHLDTGSSKTWPAELPGAPAGGTFSANCTINPAFCRMTRVYVKYCDGSSFASSLTSPYVSPTTGTNTTLYFRGRQLLDAVLASLAGLGLRDATTVLTSGCSAGGLTTYLQADYIGEQLRKNHAPKLRTYAALAVSGFFLFEDSVRREPVYEDEMRRVFARTNASFGTSSACIAAAPADSAHRCLSAQGVWPHMATPTFIINSAFDAWQTGCILAAVPESESGDDGNATRWHGQNDPGCAGVPSAAHSPMGSRVSCSQLLCALLIATMCDLVSRISWCPQCAI